MGNIIEFKCGFKNTFFIKCQHYLFSAEASSVIIADTMQVRKFHCLVLCHPDGTNFQNKLKNSSFTCIQGLRHKMLM